MTPHGPLSPAVTYVSHFCSFVILLRDCMLWILENNIFNSLPAIQLQWWIDDQTKNLENQACHFTVPTCQLMLFCFFSLFFFLFWWAEFGSHSGAGRHKKGLLAHCWFKVLPEQILGRELRAKSWPFCSLLSSANFFLGLSESIKELPECSHQSFNYSW